MRGILFRAKRIDNGEWAEGYYAESGESFILADCGLVSGHFQMHAVDPETVCQYIGLKDKNDRKIFEGDIIRFEKQVFRVGWLEGCAQYAAHPAGGIGWSPCLNVGTVKFVEVIGNVFDSPRLLGGENE